MDARLIAAVADPGTRGVTALCVELGISRQTFYKWRRRYQTGGVEGLAERSRRPNEVNHATSSEVDDLIRRLRKDLVDAGLDAGASSVLWHLEQRGVAPLPSESTIWRRLVEMGFVTPEPKKRPNKKWRRFEADRPNDRWQLDMTHWALGDGTTVEILNIIDDHSRLAVASVVATTVNSPMVWDVFVAAAALLGLPAQTLTDNGLIFSGKLRGVEVPFEVGLRSAGVRPVTSRPFHPQTCGKVERFQQTLKQWLRAQPRAADLAELQEQLDLFRLIYNHFRPHRACNRSTPAARFDATPMASAPTNPVQKPARTRISAATVNASGTIQIECGKIHLGVTLEGAEVTVVRTGNHLVILHGDTLIRSITIEPGRGYYPSGKTRGGPRQNRQT